MTIITIEYIAKAKHAQYSIVVSRRFSAVVLLLGLVVLSSGSPHARAQTPGSIWNQPDLSALTGMSGGNFELGVKFQSSEPGNVVGVMFWKTSANTGTHTGSLWSVDGTQLATVTFTSETALGWQTAYFSNPVAIAANTTYVISYFCPTNGYLITDSYFFSGGHSNGVLTALANSQSGGNGVYHEGGTGFPNTSYNSSNYWVDVVFETGEITPTETPTPAGTSTPVPPTPTATVSTSVIVLSSGETFNLERTVTYGDVAVVVSLLALIVFFLAISYLWSYRLRL